MSMVLSVYCRNAFKEFLLPAVNDADSSIWLAKSIFALEEDISVKLEVIDHKWTFVPSDEYDLIKDESSFFGQVIRDGDIIRLKKNNAPDIVIVIKETSTYFSVYEKFNTADFNNAITIGQVQECVISYDFLGLVSKFHAQIRKKGGRFFIEDVSNKNGVFVNNVRIHGNTALKFGDCIDIYGLRIVVMNNCIAVNTISSGAVVRKDMLTPLERVVNQHINSRRRSETVIFHRAPRKIAKIDTEAVEIDAAPNPKELNQPSLLMTIGPALSMALPMILGCTLAIYSTQKTGISSGVFMYTGLVTAVSSAVLGTVWALVNMKNARKKYEEEQAHRNHAYGEYLRKCDEIIRGKYQKNSEALLSRYCPAEECCRYSASGTELWNRNIRQDDYLVHRLGIGDIPFQVPIIVPKEKFSMISDNLMSMPAKIKNTYEILKNVPVCVDLLNNRLIGINGGGKKQRAIMVAQSLIAQIAANNCYTDVKLIVVHNDKDYDFSGTWKFARWLPHVWNSDKSFRYVAENNEEASDVFFELAGILRRRAESKARGSNSKEIPKPYFILVLVNPEMLEGELVSKYVMNPTPELGISTLILAENYEELPNECEYIIENSDSFSGVYHVFDDYDERIAVRIDPVSPAGLEKFSRSIANVQVKELETGGEIVNSLSFFDMYGINRLSELNVIERWRKNRTYDSMRAIIGQKAGGAPMFLDIHEKYHGPHGLVAGTTGSGKSETLQTYILSLAINFSPDDVGFFVIDYKGGGMANLFSKLPHLIGQISNLSGNQVRRAMVSIKSENLRRQRIFNEYGVNNINSYTKMFKNNEAKIAIPHMIIIIDEFAELKREEPDFMRELISVAQVGRSLGVHLILATQKPSGTVDDNIWSNSKFRLCLRVQDRQDSNDMLHRPDAAYITQAGRCYLQVGNDELFELFQSGFSGAEYSDDMEETKNEIAKMISINGKAALEGNRTKIKRRENAKIKWISSIIEILDRLQMEPEDKRQESNDRLSFIFKEISTEGYDYPRNEYNEKCLLSLIALYEELNRKDTFSVTVRANLLIALANERRKRLPEVKEKTQLDEVVEYLGKIADSNGYDNDFKLWLPVLPKELYLEDLYKTGAGFNGKDWPDHFGEWSLEVGLGLYDDPENQNQDIFTLNLATSGNIAVFGVIVSGKSTFLQTLIYSLITVYTPDDINIYALDFSSKMLAVFENAPHVGGVIFDTDVDRIDKFFAMMGKELSRRKEILRGGSYSQYLKSQAGNNLPAIVIVIDNFANLRAKTEGRYDENLLGLSKEGVGYGIFLVLSAVGLGSAELPLKYADNMRTVISLEQNDKYQYSEVLRSMHLEVLPETDVKGRGLGYVGERILEFQTALSVKADDDYQRGEAIREKCDAMRMAWKGKPAGEIPEIPEKPVFDDFILLPECAEMCQDKDFLSLGYDSKYANVYGIDMRNTYTYLISGRERSGKTNAMKILVNTAFRQGGKIIIIDTENDFGALSDSLQVSRLTNGQEIYDFLSEFIPEIQKRNRFKHELMEKGYTEEEIYVEMNRFERIFFFVGDIVSFVNLVYRPEKDVSEFAPTLDNIIEKGALHNVFWFACINQDKSGMVSGQPIFKHLTVQRKGLHLGGNISGQRILSFDYVPYMEQNKTMKPGIAMLSQENDERETRKVILPLVKG